MQKDKTEQNCAYCSLGYVIKADGNIICKKYGVIFPKDRCGKFVFDPVKREPMPRRTEKNVYTESDFSIE